MAPGRAGAVSGGNPRELLAVGGSRRSLGGGCSAIGGCGRTPVGGLGGRSHFATLQPVCRGPRPAGGRAPAFPHHADLAPPLAGAVDEAAEPRPPQSPPSPSLAIKEQRRLARSRRTPGAERKGAGAGGPGRRHAPAGSCLGCAHRLSCGAGSPLCGARSAAEPPGPCRAAMGHLPTRTRGGRRLLPLLWLFVLLKVGAAAPLPERSRGQPRSAVGSAAPRARWPGREPAAQLGRTLCCPGSARSGRFRGWG